jgi:hypothetical protein
MAANLAPRAEVGGAALDHAPSVDPVHRFIRQRAGAAGGGYSGGGDACDFSICGGGGACDLSICGGGGGGSFLDSSVSQLVALSASAPLRQIGGVEQRRISGAIVATNSTKPSDQRLPQARGRAGRAALKSR